MVDRSSASERASNWPLVCAYLVYLPAVAAVVALCRQQINVDGISYIRHAGHYAALEFALAVTGHWPPMLSWLLIPWEMAHADPILGGHMISALAGAILIFGMHHLSRTIGLTGPIAWVMPTSVGLLALTWQGRGVFPDILFAAVLTFYWSFSFRVSRFPSAAGAVATGALAGLAYLIKYYALPFFLVHHTLSTLLLGGRESRWRPAMINLKCWSFGLLAFFLVALPWIVTLSCQYGRPTYATSGKIAKSYSTPTVPSGDYWPLYRLQTPGAGRSNSWENPDEIAISWPTWSRLEFPSGLIHQLRVVYRNLGKIGTLLFEADGLGLLYMTALLIPLMCCLRFGNSLGQDLRDWRWALATFAAYVSGFVVLFAESRRYFWPVQSLLLVFAGRAALGAVPILTSGSENLGRRFGGRSWQTCLAGVIIVAVSLPLVTTARRVMSRPGHELMTVANALSEADVQGPIASNHWHRAAVIAYHLDTVCVGVPLPGTAEEVLAQLRGVQARTFLMFEDEAHPAGASALRDLTSQLGKPKLTISEGSVRVTVFTPIPGEQG